MRDVPPKGLAQGNASKGDSVSGTSILRNAIAQFGKAKGAVVGGDTYSFTFTTPSKALITVKAKLPDGTIRAKGRADFSGQRLIIPVIGGTGAYAGARGTSESESLSGDRSLNVYRLRLP